MVDSRFLVLLVLAGIDVVLEILLTAMVFGYNGFHYRWICNHSGAWMRFLQVLCVFACCGWRFGVLMVSLAFGEV